MSKQNFWQGPPKPHDSYDSIMIYMDQQSKLWFVALYIQATI